MSQLKTKGFRNGLLTGVVAAGLFAGAGALLSPGASAQAPRLVAPPPAAADGSLSFADLVERVSPAVVSVLVEREIERPRVPEALQDFFGFRFGAPDQGPNGQGGGDDFDGGVQRAEAQGSGFFIDA
ncbi:MAG TPA: hypothetical protein PKM48_12645, partial [Parvularculaceae bacterium]|nr:hypothetical protein [Parvularculaceae bacterium]